MTRLGPAESQLLPPAGPLMGQNKFSEYEMNVTSTHTIGQCPLAVGRFNTRTAKTVAVETEHFFRNFVFPTLKNIFSKKLDIQTNHRFMLICMVLLILLRAPQPN